MIKDSGERTEYSTGAVRDCKVGKGRFDLMPLGVVSKILEKEHDDGGYMSVVLGCVDDFKGGVSVYDSLGIAVLSFCEERGWNIAEMMLEVAKHFEEGAIKYGEENWKAGVPIHSYIDSAVRHYMKYKAGWTDEPHGRAFIWNMLCCIWTMENKPEMDDYTANRKAK